MRSLFLTTRFLFLLILLLTLSISTSTGTHTTDKDTAKSLPKVGREFDVIVHIVSDKGGNPGIAESSIEQTVKSINPAFEPIGISFEVKEVRTIANFTYDTLSATYYKELLVKYFVPGYINIFYVTEFPDKDQACGFATLRGISIDENNYVMMKKSCNTYDVLVHEMGHYFGLPHTFEGGDELVDGSNCMSAGDGICDTPADPFVEGDDVATYVSGACTFIHPKKDSKGNFYSPDVANPMSYYPCYCGQFTHGQYLTMIKYYYSNHK